MAGEQHGHGILCESAFDVFPEVTYERPEETWLAAIFMLHLPPFCKCLYPQERCIDKRQTVACCHNITSRQPVYCSRLQQVSWLVSLVFICLKEWPFSAYIHKESTENLSRIDKKRNKRYEQETCQHNSPVQTVSLLLLLRPSPSIQISQATSGIQKCLRSRATNLNWGPFLIISQVTSRSLKRWKWI
jgi:hypothetical protein